MPSPEQLMLERRWVKKLLFGWDLQEHDLRSHGLLLEFQYDWSHFTCHSLLAALRSQNTDVPHGSPALLPAPQTRLQYRISVSVSAFTELEVSGLSMEVRLQCPNDICDLLARCNVGQCCYGEFSN